MNQILNLMVRLFRRPPSSNGPRSSKDHASFIAWALTVTPSSECFFGLIFRTVADYAAGPELLVDILNRLQRRFLVIRSLAVVSALDPVRQLEVGFAGDLQAAFLDIAVFIKDDVAAGVPSSVKTGHSASSSTVRARSGTMWILPSKRNGRENRPPCTCPRSAAGPFFDISSTLLSIGNGPSWFRRYLCSGPCKLPSSHIPSMMYRSRAVHSRSRIPSVCRKGPGRSAMHDYSVKSVWYRPRNKAANWERPLRPACSTDHFSTHPQVFPVPATPSCRNSSLML
jgi:hypothetical protein